MSLFKSIKFALIAASFLFSTILPDPISVQVLRSPEKNPKNNKSNCIVLIGDSHAPEFTEAEQALMELLIKAINAEDTEKEDSSEESDYESDVEETPNNKFAIVWEHLPATKIYYSPSEVMLRDGELSGMITIGQTLSEEATKQGSNVTFCAADPRLHHQAPFVFGTEADTLNFAHCVLADLLAFEKQVSAFELPDEGESPAQQLKNMLWKRLFAQFSDMAKTVIKLVEDTANNTGQYSIISPSLYNILFELNSNLANYSFLHHIINYNGPTLVYAGAAHIGNPEKEEHYGEPDNVSIHLFNKQDSSDQTQKNLILWGPTVRRLAKTLIQTFGYTLIVNKNLGDSLEEIEKNLKTNSGELAETIEEALSNYILYPEQEEAEPTVRTRAGFYALADGDMTECKNLAQQLKTTCAKTLHHQKQQSEELASRHINREEIVQKRFEIDSMVQRTQTLPWDKALPLIQRLLLLLFMAKEHIDLNISALQNLPQETKTGLGSAISQSIQEGRWEKDYHTIIPTLSWEQLKIVSHNLASLLMVLDPTPSGVTTTTTTTTAITLPSSSGPAPSSSTKQPMQLLSELDVQNQEAPVAQKPLPSAHTKHARDEDDGEASQAKRRREQ